MTAPLCVVCEKRPTPDGYACSGCAGKASGQLAVIVDLAPDARLVAAGLVRRGDAGAGGEHESRPPLNDSATDTLGEVQNVLTTLARDIAETRGLAVPDARGLDPIVVAARFLLEQVEWIRHAADGTLAWAPGAYGEIGDCAGRMRGLVNGPSDRRFLGACGAQLWTPSPPDGDLIAADAPCKGNVYAWRGGLHGRCEACGAKWSTAERQAKLDAQARSHAFRASEISDAYGVNVDTIRTWSTRPRPDTGLPPLATYWRTHGGLVTPWAEPVIDNALKGDELAAREAQVAAELKARGPRLHYVDDVLDLFRDLAVRRAENEAKRARKSDERMSA